METSPAPQPSAGVTDTCSHTQSDTWGLGIQTQVPVLIKHSFLLNRLPSFLLFFFPETGSLRGLRLAHLQGWLAREPKGSSAEVASRCAWLSFF